MVYHFSGNRLKLLENYNDFIKKIKYKNFQVNKL